MPTKKEKEVKWTDENIHEHPYVAYTLIQLFEAEKKLETLNEAFKMLYLKVEVKAKAEEKEIKKHKAAKLKEAKLKTEQTLKMLRVWFCLTKGKNYCESNGCFGGRAFDIRGKMFCSPICGNKHFDLKEGDSDYWEEDESDDEDDK